MLNSQKLTISQANAAMALILDILSEKEIRYKNNPFEVLTVQKHYGIIVYTEAGQEGEIATINDLSVYLDAIETSNAHPDH